MNMLEKFANIKKLWMSNNRIRNAEFRDIQFDGVTPCFENLKLLDLSKNTKLTNAGVSLCLPHLQVLDLTKCALNSAPFLGDCPNLLVLRLKDNPTGGKKFEDLVHCSRLEILDVQNNKINWKIKLPPSKNQKAIDVRAERIYEEKEKAKNDQLKEEKRLAKELHPEDESSEEEDEEAEPVLSKREIKLAKKMAAAKLLAERDETAYKDGFRRFLSVLQALPNLHTLTTVQNAVENENYFQWLLLQNCGDLTLLNMVPIDHGRVDYPRKDKEWDEEDYYILPGQQLVEMRVDAWHEAKTKKKLRGYHTEILADFEEKRNELRGIKSPGGKKTEDENGEKVEEEDKEDLDIPVYPAGGELARYYVPAEQELMMITETQYCKYKLNHLTQKVVDWKFTAHEVAFFQFEVFMMVMHPVRPRTLLQGIGTPEEMT